MNVQTFVFIDILPKFTINRLGNFKMSQTYIFFQFVIRLPKNCINTILGEAIHSPKFGLHSKPNSFLLIQLKLHNSIAKPNE